MRNVGIKGDSRMNEYNAKMDYIHDIVRDYTADGIGVDTDDITEIEKVLDVRVGRSPGQNEPDNRPYVMAFDVRYVDGSARVGVVSYGFSQPDNVYIGPDDVTVYADDIVRVADESVGDVDVRTDGIGVLDSLSDDVLADIGMPPRGRT